MIVSIVTILRNFLFVGDVYRTKSNFFCFSFGLKKIQKKNLSYKNLNLIVMLVLFLFPFSISLFNSVSVSRLQFQRKYNLFDVPFLSHEYVTFSVVYRALDAVVVVKQALNELAVNILYFLFHWNLCLHFLWWLLSLVKKNESETNQNA